MFFSIVESISVLSATLFAGKYLANSILLIGSNSTLSRSTLVVENDLTKESNIFNDSKEKFIFLRKFLNGKDVKVYNDSWNFTE